MLHPTLAHFDLRRDAIQLQCVGIRRYTVPFVELVCLQHEAPVNIVYPRRVGSREGAQDLDEL
eukprot:5179505-Pyramimonas_sp.AAC.1